MTDLAALENHADLRPGLEAAIAASTDVVAAGAVLEIARTGWVDSSLTLKAGDQVSILASGVAWLAKPLGIGVEARMSIWRRIDGGPIAKVIDDTSTFTADKAGRLELINRWSGEWLDETGAFDPDFPHTLVEGSFTVGVIVWRGAADDGLRRLALYDDTGLAHRELTRLPIEKPSPRGWKPLWRLGRTPIFCEEAAVDGSQRINCACVRDAGILVRPVDAPLDDSTRLKWRWRVSALPSAKSEDSFITHDYLSIAVEFDNGLDLTYLWSASLPAEHAFQCPLPWWDKRETHVVVRSGLQGLGEWLSEERAVQADYRRAIGGEAPSRIVAVWLIAVSAFQRGAGVAEFEAIEVTGSRTV